MPSYVPFCCTGKKFVRSEFVRTHIITGSSKNSERPGTRNIEQNLSVLYVKHSSAALKLSNSHSRTSTNGHLSTTARFFWRTAHIFTLVSTSLQWPLSFVPRVAVVERFNNMFKLEL